jgi:hypothetical protein
MLPGSSKEQNNQMSQNAKAAGRAVMIADFCNKIGTTRRVAPPHDFGRKRGIADMTGLAAPVRPVEDDP